MCVELRCQGGGDADRCEFLERCANISTWTKTDWDTIPTRDFAMPSRDFMSLDISKKGFVFEKFFWVLDWLVTGL